MPANIETTAPKKLIVKSSGIICGINIWGRRLINTVIKAIIKLEEIKPKP